MIDTEALRSKILDLAIRGKLTEQSPEDGSAEDLYAKIQEEKAQLVKEGKIKKEKALPEITEDEIPFEIPENWKWVRWGNVINIVSARRVHQSDWRKEGIAFYRAREISRLADEGTVNNDLFISEDLYSEFSKSGVPQCGDLMVTGVGTLGKAYVVKENDKFYYKDASVLCFENYAKLNAPFLKRVMESDLMKVQINSNSGGTTVDTLTMVRMNQYLMPLPPLSEQKRIIDKVNDILERIDEIENLQSRYASNVEVLKSKLIEAGICGKLTEQFPEDGDAEDLYNKIQDEKAKLIKEGKIKKEKPLPDISEDEIPFSIPQNWKWVRLGDISAKISSGNTPAGGKNSDAYVENGYCFFREQNIYDDGIHEEGLVYITEELLKIRGNSTVLPMDILLNITGGSIGRCALVPDNFTKGSINQHILIIRMIDARLRFYVHKCICSPYIQKYIKGNVVGDKDGFSGGRCKNMLIPLPPIEEQERIVEKLKKFLLQF